MQSSFEPPEQHLNLPSTHYFESHNRKIENSRWWPRPNNFTQCHIVLTIVLHVKTAPRCCYKKMRLDLHSCWKEIVALSVPAEYVAWLH